MNKKSRKLLILVAVLVLLVAVYGMVGLFADMSEKKAEKESEQESLENVIPVVTLGSIKKIAYDNENGELSFSNNGEKWVFDGDAAFQADQTILNNFANALLGLTAQRKLTEPDALEAYGLDSPMYTVKITDDAETTQTVLLGNQTGSAYYAMLSGEKEVYTIPSLIVSYLEYDLMDFVADITMPSFSEDTVSYIRVYNGSTLELTKNGDTWTYDADGKSGTVTNTAAITDVVETVKGFTGGDCQDYNCTEEEKAEYGLDIPYYEVTVRYTDDAGKTCEFKLYVGNSLESGDSYYYANSESSMVGLVASSYVTALSESFGYEYDEAN
jgi:hypothetical protein